MKGEIHIMTSVREKILEKKIIAIIRGVGKDKMIPTVQAMVDGGIELMEVTFVQGDKEKSQQSLESISLINEKFAGKAFVGAGTVLTTKQVEDAVAAGAEYIISPNTDVAVIKKTKELGKISIPGAFTPSEVVIAHNAGADFVKLFPAGLLGVEYIKAVRAPLSNILLLAVGGVDVSNVAAFLKAGAAGVGVGGNLVNSKAIQTGEFFKITQTASEYVRTIAGV